MIAKQDLLLHSIVVLRGVVWCSMYGNRRAAVGTAVRCRLPPVSGSDCTTAARRGRAQVPGRSNRRRDKSCSASHVCLSPKRDVEPNTVVRLPVVTSVAGTAEP